MSVFLSTPEHMEDNWLRFTIAKFEFVDGSHTLHRAYRGRGLPTEAC